VRKYLYLAMAAASVAVLAAPMAASAAGTASGHVLTISKAGGTGVKTGAMLKSSLAKGTSAVFSLQTEKLTCKSASETVKVTKNPAPHGKATESLTSLTIGKCTIKVSGISGITVKSVKANNLPYAVTVSDAKGDPVTVTGTSKTKPVKTTVTVTFVGSPITCSYKATALKGAAANKTNSIAFSKQPFTKVSGSSSCPTTADFTATFGPVTDSSVKGSPKVFVN
jgi:hypothetical protein